MKKYIFFGFIIVIGLLFGFFFSQKQKVTPVVVLPAPTTIPFAPPIEIPAQQPTYIPLEQFTPPSSLALFAIGAPINKELVASSFVKRFSFMSAPAKTTGSKGEYLIWNETGKSLVIGGDPLEISFSSGAESTQPLSEKTDGYLLVASSFLDEISSVFGQTKPILVSKTFLRPTNEDPLVVSSPTDATVVLFNYSLTLDGSLLLARAAHTTTVSVGVNAQGNILSFRSYLFPSFTKTTVSTPLLSYDAARSNLTTGKGALLEFSFLGNGVENVIIQPDSPPQISTISNTRVGYYYASGASFLTPIYLFVGNGKNINSEIITTTTVVSAVK